METIIIAAVSANGIIGRKGKLAWKVSEDMSFFRRQTFGHAVLMGRKTFESLNRPLTNRLNFVLSSQDLRIGVPCFKDFASAFDYANWALVEKLFIGGGAAVYLRAIEQKLVERMLITRLSIEVEGDTRFPSVDWDEWELVSSKDFVDDKSGIAGKFQDFRRK